MSDFDTMLTEEAIAELAFEDAQERLEAIVDELEAGRLPLARALALYQLGVKLRDRCQAQLAAAETLLEQLRVNADGSTSLVESEDDR